MLEVRAMSHPDGAAEAEEVIHRLLAIHRHLRRYSKRVTSELGISGRQLAVLRRLHEAGPLSVGGLSAYLYVADSTASELLASLETAGLVTRSRSTEDNRVAVVALTPAGQALVARAPLGGVALLRQQLRSLPPEQAVALARTLATIAGLLEIDDADKL